MISSSCTSVSFIDEWTWHVEFVKILTVVTFYPLILWLWSYLGARHQIVGLNPADDGPVDLDFDADAAISSVAEEEKHPESAGQNEAGNNVEEIQNKEEEGETTKEVEYEDICIASADGKSQHKNKSMGC